MNTTTVILPEKSIFNNDIIKFDVTEANIAEMREKYMALKIDGINDKHGFNIVHEARMDVKGKRIAVDKRTKELNAPAVLYMDSTKEKQKRLKDLLAPIEDYLDSEETRIEQERETLKYEAEARESQRIQGRINKLSVYGYAVDYSEIKSMTDIAFADLLEQARIEHEKDVAAKAEAERLRKEESERLKQERAELDAIRKQQQYEANILKAEQVRIQKELEAKKWALKMQQDKIDAEKKAAELQKEQLQMIAGKARYDLLFEMGYINETAVNLGCMSDNDWNVMYKAYRETWDKNQQEIFIEKLKAEKQAQERELALRPDREKIQAFVEKLDDLNFPEVTEAESKRILMVAMTKIEELMNEIIDWLNEPSVLLAEYQENNLVTIVTEA